MLKVLMIIVVLASATTAMAADFNTPITNVDGTPITDTFGKASDFTIGKACINALSADYKDEQIDGVEKMRRWSLAKSISDHPDYHMTVEEIALVKKLVAKMYSPIVVGPVWQALDPGSAK